MKKFLKKYGLLILIIFFAILRFCLTMKLTISERQDLGVDDNWVVFTAYNLKHHGWQGRFSANAMIKGITAPLILAFSSSLGISYIGIINLMYIASVVLFIYSIKDIIKNKYILFVIYIAMLFNPIMYGVDVGQRIYRVAFVPTFSIIIASIYFYILSHKEKARTDQVLYFIILGIFVALFYNLREDTIWMLPFIIFVSIFIFINMYKQNKKIFSNLAILLIPMLITIMFNLTISTINYKYYGVFQRLDFSSNTAFSKLVSYIKDIEYDGLTNVTRVTKKKMDMLCTVSPTLNESKEYIIEFLKKYGEVSQEDNIKIANALFDWAIRDVGVNASAYESATKERDYYNKIYEELKQAEHEGKISISKNKYNFEDVKNVMKDILYTSNFVINFKEIETEMQRGSIYYTNYFGNMTEEIAKNIRIYSAEDIENFKISDIKKQEEYLQKYGKLEDILNGITNVYSKISLPILIIAFVNYFIISFQFIFNKKEEYKNLWILNSGLIGATFTLICGIALANNIYVACTIIYSYLAGAYAFLIAFEFIGICYFIKFVAEKIRKTKISEVKLKE